MWQADNADDGAVFLRTAHGGVLSCPDAAASNGKVRRRGRFVGRRPDWKKAYVRLVEGEKPIEFFEGM